MSASDICGEFSWRGHILNPDSEGLIASLPEVRFLGESEELILLMYPAITHLRTYQKWAFSFRRGLRRNVNERV
jgi:hypothetical protein